MKHLLYSLLIVGLAMGLSSTVAAQDVRLIEDDEWCDEEWRGDRDSYRHCEVRELTLAATGDRIDVDSGQNGGISVIGWDRDEILVRARVQANARSLEEAEDIAEAVEILTSRSQIRADGPDTSGRRKSWYSVSFELYVPNESDMDLEANNGGISVEEVTGNIRFETLNGGVHLAGVGGDVTGHTTNGGIRVDLTGTEWTGDGLDVETTNGGVKIIVPEDYSAELESGTVNGRIDVDFPVMVQGQIGRRLNATLGDGGKTIRATTTNGGVVIQHG